MHVQSNRTRTRVHLYCNRSISDPMKPNVRGSVTDYANEKCVYARRCLGPINRPWPVAGLNGTVKTFNLSIVPEIT